MRLVELLAIVGHISYVISENAVEFEKPAGCHSHVRYAFSNPTIFKTATELGCGRKCGQTPSCLAFNSHKNGVNTICELGDQETAAGDCSNLEFSDGSTYMEKRMPCENGGHWDKTSATCIGCAYGYTGKYCERLFRGCTEAGVHVGILRIQTSTKNKPIDVLCEGDVTVIEKRGSPTGAVYFNRTWNEYKNGFGDMDLPNGNFFVGLDRIHDITSTSDCRFTIFAMNPSVIGIASYDSWVIASEDESYAMSYTAYDDIHSNIYDGLTDSNSSTFSAHDKGNRSGCATKTRSGWWFNAACNGVNMHKPKLGGFVLQWPTSGNPTQFKFFKVHLHCSP